MGEPHGAGSREDAPGAAVAVRAAQASEDHVVVAVPRSGVDLEAVERALIAFALEQSGGNRTRAARFLRLTRSALLYRMHKYRLAGSARTDPAS